MHKSNLHGIRIFLQSDNKLFCGFTCNGRYAGGTVCGSYIDSLKQFEFRNLLVNWNAYVACFFCLLWKQMTISTCRCHLMHRWNSLVDGCLAISYATCGTVLMSIFQQLRYCTCAAYPSIDTTQSSSL